MSAGLVYLSAAEALYLHEALISRYGGIRGLRDPGALDAAMARPQSGYYEDIISEAAALMESLAVNHPFLDGNKRIAFAAADVFLRINGWSLKRAPGQIYQDMMGFFDSGAFDYQHLEPWLRSFAVRSAPH